MYNKRYSQLLKRLPGRVDWEANNFCVFRTSIPYSFGNPVSQFALRDKLKSIRQGGSINAYIELFEKLVYEAWKISSSIADKNCWAMVVYSRNPTTKRTRFSHKSKQILPPGLACYGVRLPYLSSIQENCTFMRPSRVSGTKFGENCKRVLKSSVQECNRSENTRNTPLKLHGGGKKSWVRAWSALSASTDVDFLFNLFMCRFSWCSSLPWLLQVPYRLHEVSRF